MAGGSLSSLTRPEAHSVWEGRLPKAACPSPLCWGYGSEGLLKGTVLRVVRVEMPWQRRHWLSPRDRCHCHQHGIRHAPGSLALSAHPGVTIPWRGSRPGRGNAGTGALVVWPWHPHSRPVAHQLCGPCGSLGGSGGKWPDSGDSREKGGPSA